MSIGARLFEAFSSRARPQAAEVLRSTVGGDGNRLRALLSSKASDELTAEDIRTEVEGNLWMVAPDAFRYFLPAFLRAALASYSKVSIFASELVGALTEPSRADVAGAVDQVSENLLGGAADVLRQQQLDWFDSGTPSAIFHERFDTLTPAEGAAVLEFLSEFQRAHGANFPFDEIETAIGRYWSCYGSS